MTHESTQPEQLQSTSDLIIRPINIHNDEEIKRVKEIENNPLRIRWFYNDASEYHEKTDEELISFLTNTTGNDLVFAVIGDGKRDDIVTAGEAGKLQGLVYVNPETQFRQEELKKILPINSSSLLLEVSYAKRDGALGGQMGKAVRQVCRELARINNSFDRSNIFINAYIMTDSRGTNEPSVKLLEASGFDETGKAGKIFYEPTIKDPDRVFTLNWEKLDALLASS